jgi:cystathionine beta-lyase
MPKNTQCVHSGARKDPSTRGLNTPIYPSSAYEYLDAVENTYPRYFNTPNERAVVERLCALEGAEEGLLFSSGMAAISTVLLAFLESGGHAVLQRDIYGGTHHFATADFNRLGIQFSFAGRRAEEIEAAIRPNTRLIYIETPSNPLLRITDIAAAAEIGRRRGLVTVIDNTFASPINQNPIGLGIDIVTHSATKYIGGHSDLSCGAALGSAARIRRVRETAVNLGGNPNAFTCYLLERSLKTLAVRVERQNRNAQAVAEFLQRQPAVATVNYPGLDSHPGHAIAARQMHAFGGMLSFELDPARCTAERFLRRLQLITPALSLGGVETIICAPSRTSHGKLSAEERRELGIADGLLRLSVGIEDAADIIADISQALGV